MAKRKHYVYMVNETKEVCSNLQSAIELAIADMYKAERKYVYNAQLSAPLITKIWGGYQVVAVGYNGTIHKRCIDVFEPYKQLQRCKQYKVDRIYAMQYQY